MWIPCYRLIVNKDSTVQRTTKLEVSRPVMYGLRVFTDSIGKSDRICSTALPHHSSIHLVLDHHKPGTAIGWL